MNNAEFKGKIQALKTVLDNMEKISDILNADFPEWLNLFLDEYLNLLNNALNIPEENDTIRWWIFETNFGKDNAQIYDSKTHEQIDNLQTVSDLWRYLMDSYPKGCFT